MTPSRLAFNVFKEGSWHILVTEHGSLEYSADSGGAVITGQILWDMRYAHLLDLLALRSGFHSSLALDNLQKSGISPSHGAFPCSDLDGDGEAEWVTSPTVIFVQKKS